MRPRLDALDAEVLTAIEHKALRPEVVRAAVKRAVELIKVRAAANTERPAAARRELAKAERERDNLVAALATGRTKPAAIIAAIAEREQHIEALRRELAQLESPPLLDQLGDKRTERQLNERLTQFGELLRANVPLTRQALRKLQTVPILFYPELGGGYRLNGTTQLGALFAEEPLPGGKVTSAKVASPRDAESTPPIEWESEAVLRPRWWRAS